MAESLVLIDTSILIDLFRKTNKENSNLVSLVRQGYTFCISSITEYEIYTGATLHQINYWDDFLEITQVLPFDKNVARVAVKINAELKKKRKLIDLADLFIAATAIANNLPISTLNKKHFNRINELTIIE